MTETMQCPVRHDFEPLSDAYLADPYAVLNEARESQPIFFAPSIGYWVVTRYEDIKAILSDPETFSARIALQPLVPLSDSALAVMKAGMRSTPVLVDCDGAVHTRVRRRVGDALSVRRMNLLKPIIEQRCDSLIDNFAANGRADLVSQLTFPLPALTIFTLLGFPGTDAERLKTWCTDKLEVTWGRPSPEYQLRAVENMAAFWSYCEKFVELRKDEPRDDLTSELIAQRGGDPDALDDRELASVVFALSFAGHETTTNLMSNALLQVLSTSRVARWRELCAQPDLTPRAIEEVLRYDTPVVVWRRVARTDASVGGLPVPAGAKLLLAFSAANHDPRHFHHPETFDMRRDNSHTQLSFGWGVHYCLGASLARMECEIVIRRLCQRLPNLQLVPDQKLTFPATVTLRGPHHLWAEWLV